MRDSVKSYRVSDMERMYEQVCMLYSLLTPEQKQQFVQLQKEKQNG
jgi:Spy/CpxP family protein refolding chaperone